MLRDETKTRMIDRPWTRSRRMVTAFGLLGLAIGVATLRGPAWGAEDGPPPAAPAVARHPSPEPDEASVPIYLREDADGISLVRPQPSSVIRGWTGCSRDHEELDVAFPTRNNSRSIRPARAS